MSLFLSASHKKRKKVPHLSQSSSSLTSDKQPEGGVQFQSLFMFFFSIFRLLGMASDRKSHSIIYYNCLQRIPVFSLSLGYCLFKVLCVLPVSVLVPLSSSVSSYLPKDMPAGRLARHECTVQVWGIDLQPGCILDNMLCDIWVQHDPDQVQALAEDE